MIQSCGAAVKFFFSATWLDRITYVSFLTMLGLLPFTKAGIEIFLTIGVLAWIGRKIVERDFSFKRVPLVKIYVLFILTCLMSLWNSEYIYASLRGVQKVVKYFLLYCASSETFTTEERLSKAVKVLLTSAIFSCWDGLYQYWTGWNFRYSRDFLMENHVRRISATFNHPNNYGAFLLSVIFIAAHFESNKKWQALRLWAIPLMFMLLLYSGSRSCLLILMTGFLLLGIFQKTGRKYAFYLMAVFLCGGLLYAFTNKPAFLRTTSFFFGNERLTFWSIAYEMFLSHPVIGVGINTFMSNFPTQVGMSRYVSLPSSYAHSVIFQYLAEIGLLGLLSFLFLVTSIFFKAVFFLRNRASANKSYSIVKGILLGMIALFVHSCVDTDLQSLQLVTLFWFSVGIVSGFCHA